MVGAVPESYSYNNGEAYRYCAFGWVLVDKVDLYVLDRAAPATKAEDLIGEIDGFFSRQVGDARVSRTSSC